MTPPWLTQSSQRSDQYTEKYVDKTPTEGKRTNPNLSLRSWEKIGFQGITTWHDLKIIAFPIGCYQPYPKLYRKQNIIPTRYYYKFTTTSDVSARYANTFRLHHAMELVVTVWEIEFSSLVLNFKGIVVEKYIFFLLWFLYV